MIINSTYKLHAAEHLDIYTHFLQPAGIILRQ